MVLLRRLPVYSRQDRRDAQGEDPLRHVLIRLYVDDYIANSTKRTRLRYQRLREIAHATHHRRLRHVLMRFCFARLACVETPSKDERAPLFLVQKNGVGAVVCAAAQNYIPVIELTPQQVKRASGLGTKIDKNTVKAIASRLFGTL